MLQTYAKHVPHPFASVMGQEVFESGVIPSDTDFRIYRDYGNIPGKYRRIKSNQTYSIETRASSMVAPAVLIPQKAAKPRFRDAIT